MEIEFQRHTDFLHYYVRLISLHLLGSVSRARAVYRFYSFMLFNIILYFRHKLGAVIHMFVFILELYEECAPRPWSQRPARPVSYFEIFNIELGSSITMCMLSQISDESIKPKELLKTIFSSEKHWWSHMVDSARGEGSRETQMKD